jgi:phosphomannomutase
MMKVSQFREIVDAYRQHLRSTSKGNIISFEMFCKPYNVRLESVYQWMRRHCISVASLIYEVMLEKYLEDPTNNSFPEIYTSASIRNKEQKDQTEKHMEGVVITFPDGVSVKVRKSTPENVNRLIEQYNNKNTIDNVWAE